VPANLTVFTITGLTSTAGFFSAQRLLVDARWLEGEAAQLARLLPDSEASSDRKSPRCIVRAYRPRSMPAWPLHAHCRPNGTNKPCPR
jgi:hypothetical protein